ncbi:MAG: class I SAM-dependent methyltransferase [Bryobacteraceae bacterium]
MGSAELIEILREVRERVRARNPQTAAGVDIALPDLMPLMHARDAAMGKVAAIGTVNPRAGGPVNGVVQTWKRLLARVLDWHVREQVEFNRNVVAYADAVLQALRESNRALSEMGGRLAQQEKTGDEMKDMRGHWAAWRTEWEHTLQVNEVQFLRSVADLQGAFQHQVTRIEATHRDLIRGQNTEFHAALERHGFETQKRLWAVVDKMRAELERMIHGELRMIRQRAQIRGVASPAEPPAEAGPGPGPVYPPLAFDYSKFAERFRGTEEYVKAGQQLYLPYFEGCRNVLDIGCGRGEFLEVMRDASIPARGIDVGAESVAVCRLKGLDAEIADVFPYLASMEEGALDGIFCSQVVEHLPPERLPEMIRLCAERLARGGVIVIETPNPECLAIFGTHFYLDPTHTRPVPHPLLMFYLEEYGVGLMQLRRLSPAVETMPSLGSLPDDFRGAFFDALDYAVIGRKL